jgi:hypothetical protein
MAPLSYKALCGRRHDGPQLMRKEPAKRAVAHAVSISSGGPPLFLIAEEETTTF